MTVKPCDIKPCKKARPARDVINEKALQEGDRTRSKEYIIPVRPIAWQRAQLNGKRFFDGQVSEKLHYGLLLQRLHGQEPKFYGPIEVNFVFYMPIPKNSYDKTKGIWHYKRPDGDNLQKFFLDAAQSVLFDDDCIVCKGTWEKKYDKVPRTHVIIRELS